MPGISRARTPTATKNSTRSTLQGRSPDQTNTKNKKPFSHRKMVSGEHIGSPLRGGYATIKEEKEMREPTLLILAAGMGSRYGGAKQIDPIGKNGEIIIDFSCYDAIRAGFKNIVFLIRESMRADVEQIIGSKVAKHANVSYVYQEGHMYLPEGFTPPEGRVKPWGTAHAVLCCREAVGGNFAMINADDYYGPEAYRKMYEKLCETPEDSQDYSMVGYMLGNTLTDHGKVARGVCETEGTKLKSIVERTHIVKTAEGAKFSTDEGETFTAVSTDSPVSMNFWGFTSKLFEEIAERFPKFLAEDLKANPLGAEFYIPNLVGTLLREGACSVEVLKSGDKWHGVTYKEDKPAVSASVRALQESGLYPEKLWEI